jgi:hypothetical protein
MSVLEDLKAIERQLVDRLRELEPLVAEYEELRRAAERLGVDYRQGSGARASADGGRQRRASSAPRQRGPRRRSGPVGRRAEQVMDAVRTRPGITVPEIGQQLGIDYTGLYRVVRQLEKEGRLRKDGKELQLAG